MSNDQQDDTDEVEENKTDAFVHRVAKASDTADVYHALGNLRLPRPTGDYKERAEPLEADLLSFNNRSMKGNLTSNLGNIETN